MTRFSTAFRFPLSIDPLRFLVSLVERWKWLFLLGILVGIAGTAAGAFLLSDKHTAIFTIRNAQVSRFGDDKDAALPSPYRPPELKSDAVVVTATADQVIEAAIERLRANGHPEAGDLGWRVELDEVKRSGIFELKAISNTGPEEAMSLGRAWGDAILAHLQEEQKAAAADAAEQLGKRIARHQAKLEGLNEELLEKARKADVFDEVTTMQSLHMELAELKAAQSVAESDLEAKVGQVVAYQREINGAGWLRGEIDKKGRELEELRGKVTSLHPRVTQLKAEITALNRELETVLVEGESNDPLISSALYGDTRLTLMRLEEEKELLADRIVRYDELIAGLKKEIEALPAKAVAIADSKARWQEALETSATLETYLKEAEFYRSEALSPLRYLVEPEDATVEFTSKYLKGGVLGGLAGFCAVFLAAYRICRKEVRKEGLRTPLQAAISSGSFPLLQLPSPESGERQGRMREFWLTTVASQMPEKRNFLFVSVDEASDEHAFWNEAFDALEWDMPQVVFVDVSPTPYALSYRGNPVPMMDAANPTRYQVSAIHLKDYTCGQIQALKDFLPSNVAIVVRWSVPPSAVLRQLFLGFDCYYTISSVKSGFTDEVESKCRILRKLLGESSGMVLTDSESRTASRRFLNRLEMNYLANLRNESEPEPVPDAPGIGLVDPRMNLPDPRPWLT